MDEKKKENAAAGKNRASNFFALRLAAAAYLAYLGFDLLRDFLAGASTIPAAGAWGFGLGFLAAGLGFGIYSFLCYRRETAKEKEKAEETGKMPDGD
jgi:hypothetical protein